ncbi:MAG: transposase [Cytophagaceae bacterium]|nr:transposase [Cytophagaceae bacterium]
MFLDEVYFWTDTVYRWHCLLKPDKYKEIVVDYLKELVEEKHVIVYGFVIMPNHLHLVWEMKSKVGKEMPYASFNKHTAHETVKDLKSNHPNVLAYFVVNDAERQHRIWRRNPLAILMNSRLKVEQKLDYIHRDPLHERWNLADQPENYRWSSATFYETREDEFGILTHYMERF